MMVFFFLAQLHAHVKCDCFCGHWWAFYKYCIVAVSLGSWEKSSEISWLLLLLLRPTRFNKSQHNKCASLICVCVCIIKHKRFVIVTRTVFTLFYLGLFFVATNLGESITKVYASEAA